MNALRQRLFDPPNAVADYGIDLRRPKGVRGYARHELEKPVQRLLLQMPSEQPKPEITPPAPPYVWPGNLCGEFWLPDIPNEYPPPIIKQIISAVAAVWEVSAYEIIGPRRMLEFMIPRQVGVALACRLTKHSLLQIGQHFGNRDHTTILHAKRKMAAHMTAIESNMTELSSPGEWARAMKARLEA